MTNILSDDGDGEGNKCSGNRSRKSAEDEVAMTRILYDAVERMTSENQKVEQTHSQNDSATTSTISLATITPETSDHQITSSEITLTRSDSKNTWLRRLEETLTLPANHSSRCQRFLHIVLVWFLSLLHLVLLPLLIFACSEAALNEDFSRKMLRVMIAYVCAELLGRLCGLLKVFPPLLGMMVAGILLRVVLPYLDLGFDESEGWPVWSSNLRGVALVVILLRAGLGLDHAALRRMSGTVFRLAFLPCLVEAVTASIATKLILGFPWLWAFLMGFLLASVSPAVVVPSLLQLRDKGYGVSKGIPTLVVAAASLDNVLAISGFNILLGITFKPDADLVTIIFQAPIEIIIGLSFGLSLGLFLSLLPRLSQGGQQQTVYFFSLLLAGSIMALFGARKLGYPGAGALAVLVSAFSAGVGWGEGRSKEAAGLAGLMWTVFQPLLFGLIGTEIKLTILDPTTIGYGFIILVIGLAARSATTYLSVLSCSCRIKRRNNDNNNSLNLKERVFVVLCWLPKGTVQAALATVPLEMVRKFQQSEDYSVMGLQVLTVAVLAILVTAPVGALAVSLSGPRMLTTATEVNDDEKKM